MIAPSVWWSPEVLTLNVRFACDHEECKHIGEGQDGCKVKCLGTEGFHVYWVHFWDNLMKSLWKWMEDLHPYTVVPWQVSLLHQTHPGIKTRCEGKVHRSAVNKLTNLIEEIGCHIFPRSPPSCRNVVLRAGLWYRRQCQGGCFWIDNRVLNAKDKFC